MKELANPKQALLTRQTWKYLVVEFETPSGDFWNSSQLNRIVDYPTSGNLAVGDCDVASPLMAQLQNPRSAPWGANRSGSTLST